MVNFEIPLLVSSDPLAGALNVSDDGSQFEVVSDQPLIIPEESINCELFVSSSQVWNVVPNVILNENDTFYIEISAVSYVINIPQGLYDLNTLEQTIDNGIVSAGGVSGAFSFLANDPTQQVVIRLNIADVQIDFTQLDTPRELLGFDSQLVPTPNPSVGLEFYLADNTAAFNNIDFFLIHSDICEEGIQINNDYNQAICKVVIGDTSPSSLITNEFNVPVKVPCNHLIGAARKSWRVWLTDQNNNRVNTQGEAFSCQIVLSIKLPDVN